ncbi:MAG TPA: hypothetical protein VK668_11765 [Mucilaginibacter sp.]|nr:hypothetical protein [Mucilaginibacter sp.]
MYWYNPTGKKIVFLLACFLVLQGCKKDSAAASDTMKYFDLKGYFRADSIRLSKMNPLVNKTVVHNKASETKKVHIPDWGTELSLFTESDINKPAWKESYSVQSSGDFLIYKAKDPALKTRDIIIKRNGDKIKWILVFNHTKNVLYETQEKLSYFPDSLYIIQKAQRVRLLGTDTYKITGAFN